MSFRPMPVLSVLTLLSLAILIWLGNWQYGRYTGKLGQQAETETIFQSVRVDIDRTNEGLSQQVYGIIDGEAVWRRYLPGRIDGNGPIVLVAWDATASIEPIPLDISEHGRWMNAANVFLRDAQTGGIASRNDPENDTWFAFDAPAIMDRLGYEQATARVVEPRDLTILKEGDRRVMRETENPYATPVVRDPLPPERHFGYALTWWGLAMALIGVYVAFHHSKGRLRFKR